jgi:hypothetical protein
MVTNWISVGSKFESRQCQEFSFLHVVRAGSAVHRATYTMGPGGSSPRIKRPGRGDECSPPVTTEVTKMYIYITIPRIAARTGARVLIQ